MASLPCISWIEPSEALGTVLRASADSAGVMVNLVIRFGFSQSLLSIVINTWTIPSGLVSCEAGAEEILSSSSKVRAKEWSLMCASFSLAAGVLLFWLGLEPAPLVRWALGGAIDPGVQEVRRLLFQATLCMPLGLGFKKK